MPSAPGVKGFPLSRCCCCCWTQRKPHRKNGTLKDSVWVSYCQFWHFFGRWSWAIHSREHCSVLQHPQHCKCHLLQYGYLSRVLSVGKLLILWPHAPCVAMGLFWRWCSAWITANIITKNTRYLENIWNYYFKAGSTAQILHGCAILSSMSRTHT